MNDIIAAIATPPGSGALGIVRLSGAGCLALCDRFFAPRAGAPLSERKGYTACLGDIADADGTRIDEAVALVYRAPKSYTGEESCELMCHGGEQVLSAVLERALSCGAAPAAPGEFTRRALLNGQLTLTQAEAVCDLINAASRQGEQAAAALQHGALHQKTQELKDRILDIQAHISAWIDFPEEDVEALDESALLQSLSQLLAELDALLAGYARGALLLRGVPTVIAGSPNVGKSTLLNLLAGAPKAIVTPVPGTTRDIIEQPVRLGGTVLLLADTAGIRRSDDPVESIGIGRSLQRLDEAALILAVFDSSRALDGDDRRLIERIRGKNVIGVINKSDLPTLLDSAEIAAAFPKTVLISAHDAGALAQLDAAVADVLRLAHPDDNAVILANARQRDCALRCRDAVAEALDAARQSTPDVVTALLTEALQALAELSGEEITEALLDAVFSRFCVGK